MEASNSYNEAPPGFPDTSVHHADMLRRDSGQAPADQRFSAPESYESDCSCDGGIFTLLDTLQSGHHGRYTSKSQSGGERLLSSTLRKLGHVYHAEPGAAALLCQPRSVRLCGREVQDEVLPHDPEDTTDRAQHAVKVHQVHLADIWGCVSLSLNSITGKDHGMDISV